jgi:hypothetical protein
MATPAVTTKAINKTVSDHVFNSSAIRSIEDRPATVVNKIWVLTCSDIIMGRCDIFAAPVHRLEQIERREIGSVQRGAEKCVRSKDVRGWMPAQVVMTDVRFDW